MRTKKVVVLPYDRIWKSDFEEIKREIEGAIGDLMFGIEHVGSTSVEGMSAKPVIDIDVIIKDYAVFDAVVRRLEAIGYVHEGNLGINDKKSRLSHTRQAASFIQPGGAVTQPAPCLPRYEHASHSRTPHSRGRLHTHIHR